MLFSNKWSFGAAKRMWSFKKINQILNSNIEERKQTSHSSRIRKGFVAQIGLGDLCCESRVIAECHEELDTNHLQDQELVELWLFSEATRLPFDLVWRRDGLKTGSLKRAAEKMNVTQSMVTARLKVLEQEPGRNCWTGTYRASHWRQLDQNCCAMPRWWLGCGANPKMRRVCPIVWTVCLVFVVIVIFS